MYFFEISSRGGLTKRCKGSDNVRYVGRNCMLVETIGKDLICYCRYVS